MPLHEEILREELEETDESKEFISNLESDYESGDESEIKRLKKLSSKQGKYGNGSKSGSIGQAMKNILDE